MENGYIETKFLMNSADPPTAIFATNDQITIGALKALNEEDIKIPDDVSLVAFDDTDFAPFLEAPLTTIRQPKELMGEMAVKLLMDDINSKGNQKEKSRIILKPKLIIRKSVSELSVAE